MSSYARAEPSARVELPHGVDTPSPAYPDGAEGNASVVLDLVVSADGKIIDARIVEGVAPFANAARDAAAAWTFEPARKDGVAVAARIRFRVDFTPPAPLPAPEGRPSPAAPSSLPRAATPAAPPEQVTVRGSRGEAPHVEMRAAEVREIPGAFGDAFRAMEAMPGVIPILSGLPYFLVRGAPPGNTGFFLDGVRVPSLFHFGIGAAVIHPALVDRVDLYPGAYPARFGRYTGGILTGSVVPPATQAHGEVSVRLLDAGALVEVPFANGKGDAMVSGRYGYPGPLLSVFVPNTGLQYWDYQARVGFRLDDGSHIGVFAFGSYDSLTQRDDITKQMVQILGIEFHRVDFRYDHPTAGGGSLRIAATVGYDRTATGDTGLAARSEGLQSETFALRTEWTGPARRDVEVRVGADVIYEPYRFSSLSTPAESEIPSGFGVTLPTFQNDLNLGAYAELAWRVAPNVDIDPGLRADVFTSRYPNQTGYDPSQHARAVPALDPRLSVRWQITPRVAWIPALGVAHQASNIPFPIPAFQFSQLGRGLQGGYQASQGVEVKLPAELVLTADAFVNDLTGLAQLSNDCPSGLTKAASTACELQTVNGRAVGFELLIRRPLTRRLSGWLSYTLSRAERDRFDGSTGQWGHRLSEFDRPHVVNVVGAYDLGAGWRAGARFVGYSGLPYSTVSDDGTPNARSPPFFRLDLRLEKRWKTKWGRLSVILEWLNVFLAKEDIGVSCGAALAGPGQVTEKCSPQAVGPITFPSVGVEAAF